MKHGDLKMNVEKLLNRGPYLFVGVVCVEVVVAAGIGYVVWHFISKFW